MRLSPLAASILLLLVTCAFGHPFGDKPTVGSVLDHWRNAVHSGKQTGEAGMTIVRTSDAEGIPATDTIVVTASGEYREHTIRENDSMIFVIAKQGAWWLDWNGYLRTVRGKELERMRTNAVEMSIALLGPPSEQMKAVTVQAEGDSVAVLAMQVPGGETVTWTIDVASGLPRSSMRRGEDSMVTTTYSDWQMVGSMKVPFGGRVVEPGKPEYSWKISSTRFILSPDESEFVKPVAGHSDTHMESTIPPIPFNFENSHIIFPLSLNGKDSVLFLFDTGADEEAINEAYLPQFNLHPYGKTTTTGGGNSVDYSYASGATFKLPGVEIRNQHVSILDETGLEKALGMKLGGILGFDFISRFVVEIDYQHNLLTLHDPKNWEYKGNGYIVPVTFDNGIPFANATISVPTKPSIPAYFVLDFGAAETMTLTSPFVKANDLITLAGTNATVNRLAGLENQFFAQSNTRGRIDQLMLGTLPVKSFPVNMSVNAKGAYASPTFSGTIGEGIYKRYHVYIDYQRDRVIFETTSETDTPYPERRTYGLTIIASGAEYHTYTITAVRPDSPASKDGFMKGDVVSSVDGKPTSAFTLGALRDWVSHEGGHHTIVVTRDSKEVVKAVDVQLVSLDKK